MHTPGGGGITLDPPGKIVNENAIKHKREKVCTHLCILFKTMTSPHNECLEKS